MSRPEQDHSLTGRQSIIRAPHDQKPTTRVRSSRKSVNQRFRDGGDVDNLNKAKEQAVFNAKYRPNDDKLCASEGTSPYVIGAVTVNNIDVSFGGVTFEIIKGHVSDNGDVVMTESENIEPTKMMENGFRAREKSPGEDQGIWSRILRETQG
ncbi:hypothetical protein CH63R_08067 [Colletotrichum higginsianum IMI 349063]|uniref:Uncharacterized protein n=2 Tax=Colletotrichum higginsianum (strain IMI 349063) TaxID=759273 RepID=A0A1B7YB58_COLHI|nr:hypothetical protein CH63R_08067 [Colletotrichum higginsianum IMI 349063]OBR09302.1 hypothetical protein CH63R_08067 [Colletotrichum higginsianum IMI 349063]